MPHDNIRAVENAIVRGTSMLDSLIEEKTNAAQETLFASLNLENYIANPTTEIQNLIRLLLPDVVAGFEEAIEGGLKLSDAIERSA